MIQISLRLSPKLYELLRKKSFDTHTSINKIITEAIEKHLNEER